MRVVVYAEGVSELHGEFTLSRAPRATLPEAELGAAHVLVRRTIAFADASRATTVQFEEPLQLRRGIAHGSDLLNRKNLRLLLSWGQHLPDLAVVLVDEDGVETRLSTLKSYLDVGWTPPVAVGVAVREFESWLIGDMQAVREVLARTIDEPPEREGMKPREAKRLFTEWIEQSGRAAEHRIQRIRIAERLRLEEARTLQQILPALPG